MNLKKSCCVLLTAAVCIALAILRFAFPAVRENVKNEIKTAIGFNPGEPELLESIGTDLSNIGLHAAIVKAIKYSSQGKIYPVFGDNICKSEN
ncbi:MAG: hypothetical protein ACOX68_05260 [Candidatus Limivicinus sp.]